MSKRQVNILLRSLRPRLYLVTFGKTHVQYHFTDHVAQRKVYESLKSFLSLFAEPAFAGDFWVGKPTPDWSTSSADLIEHWIVVKCGDWFGLQSEVGSGQLAPLACRN
jgi:hypothetical protein